MLVKRVCHTWALTCVLIVGALAAMGAEPAADAAKPWVVKIHADWCPTCVRLMPTWERIEAERARLVVFDVTDERTSLAAARQAEKLGLTEFFGAFGKRTGTIAVLDPDSARPVKVLKGETDLRAYEQAITAAGG